MPGKGQKCVTIPEEVFIRVSQEVEAGREKSVAGTFVKAVKLYLDIKDRDTIQETIDWCKKLQQRFEELRATRDHMFTRLPNKPARETDV